MQEAKLPLNKKTPTTNAKKLKHQKSKRQKPKRKSQNILR